MDSSNRARCRRRCRRSRGSTGCDKSGGVWPRIKLVLQDYSDAFHSLSRIGNDYGQTLTHRSPARLTPAGDLDQSTDSSYSVRRIVMMSSPAMRRVPAQILADATKARHRTEKVDVVRSTAFAPSIRRSRKRPLSIAPATPGIAPAATVSRSEEHTSE